MIRRHRYGLITIALTVLLIWYIATGKSSTQNSAFYRKTQEAIERRRNEGPQAPGHAHKTFLKGGSIRDDERKIDPTPLDDEDSLLTQIDTQMGKGFDTVAEVERLDRGLETAAANARAGQTDEDKELERQMLQARKREKEKLKAELRDQLKMKERERQKTVGAQYVNPNWVGAFEKERKPVAANAGDLEVAPDSDPFRDKPKDGTAESGDAEKAPDSDPFRDKPVEKASNEDYKAPVAIGQGGSSDAQHLELKKEQQQQKLAKEQEYLEPVQPVAGKQHPTSEDDPKRALQKDREIDPEAKRQIIQGTGKTAAAVPAAAAANDRASSLRDPDAREAASERSQTYLHNAATNDDAVKKDDPPGAPASKSAAELELSRLLALSPMTIFSKSYCPYSKKAKAILLEKFEIMPKPYVVELDKHEHGAELQKLLGEKTGRRTVPNVIIDGQSLGGGDEVESLAQSGGLRDTIKAMGGKRIMSVVEKKS